LLLNAELVLRENKNDSNNILFNIADQILSPKEQSRLQQEYKTAIPTNASAKSGEVYEEIVTMLCERWNVDAQDVA